jgi:hypothetical protein
MDIGMLWYDDDTKRPLGEKVARAVDYYKTKYGSVPTVCFINPAAFKDAPDTAAGVQIRSARNVMLDHFWLGVGESNGNGNGNGHAGSAQRKNGARQAEGNGRAQAGPARSNGSRAGRAPAQSSTGRAG